MDIALISDDKNFTRLAGDALSQGLKIKNMGQKIAFFEDFKEFVEQKDDYLPIFYIKSPIGEELKKFIAQKDSFAVLSSDLSEDINDLEDFRGVYAAPTRLGVLTEAILYYLRQRQISQGLKPIKMGDYLLNPALYVLSHQAQDIKLTEKEQDILLHLYHHRPAPVSRQELLNHVWGFAKGVETHTLETHIYRLRQKIEHNPALPQFLMTDDRGYYLGGVS